MWKIFAVIGAVLLGGAAYLSHQNKAHIDQKMSELDQERLTLASRQRQLEETKEEIATLNQSIVMLRDETEKFNTQKIDLDNKVVQTESELRLVDSQITTAQEKLDRGKSLVEDIEDVEKIRQQMAEIRTQIEESEIDITKKEGQVASNKVDTDRLAGVAAELKALRQDQENGIIRSEFESSIAKAYNQWGFVVVNGGNDQGVVDNAQLDVYRRGQFICKLLVTQVEAGQSVADIVPGSLQPGQSVLAGDTVVKAIKSVTPAVPGDATVAPAPQPDDGGAGVTAPQPDQGAPANDPFGGGGMQGGGEPDPFGGGGGMQGGGEPDPFGGGGGMQGGGEPDPFGGDAADPFGQ